VLFLEIFEYSLFSVLLMRTATLHHLGYLVFILNHICFLLIREKPISKLFIVVTGIFVLIMILLGLYDYQFHYKKTGRFSVPFGMFFALNVAMWTFNSSYLFIAINVVLWIAFFLWNKHLVVKENLVD
jgi:hypothetical protein